MSSDPCCAASLADKADLAAQHHTSLDFEKAAHCGGIRPGRRCRGGSAAATFPCGAQHRGVDERGQRLRAQPTGASRISRSTLMNSAAGEWSSRRLPEKNLPLAGAASASRKSARFLRSGPSTSATCRRPRNGQRRSRHPPGFARRSSSERGEISIVSQCQVV